MKYNSQTNKCSQKIFKKRPPLRLWQFVNCSLDFSTSSMVPTAVLLQSFFPGKSWPLNSPFSPLSEAAVFLVPSLMYLRRVAEFSVCSIFECWQDSGNIQVPYEWKWELEVLFFLFVCLFFGKKKEQKEWRKEGGREEGNKDILNRQDNPRI